MEDLNAGFIDIAGVSMLVSSTVSFQRRARRYAEATDEELPLPGKRTTKRPTARTILDSFDAVIFVQLPDGSRLLSESKPFPDKMLRTLGVSHYRRRSA
ncbi:MAG: hypothetical protein VB144_13070 [Clostridia bacterium]|nr:hypothetical protein [Clostridia bacterium]